MLVLSKSVMDCISDRVIPLCKLTTALYLMTSNTAEDSNSYFAAQMTISENSDGIPTLPWLTYITDDRLAIARAEEADVLSYLRMANPNKSSGPGEISNYIP
jgi:hypothetical protein